MPLRRPALARDDRCRTLKVATPPGSKSLRKRTTVERKNTVTATREIIALVEMRKTQVRRLRRFRAGDAVVAFAGHRYRGIVMGPWIGAGSGACVSISRTFAVHRGGARHTGILSAMRRFGSAFPDARGVLPVPLPGCGLEFPP